MGEIRKQGILYSLFSYIGVVLGFVNTVLLYPIVLTEAEIGIIGFILVGGSLMGILGQLGMPSAIIRFFPHYKNKENNHANFLSFALLITLIGTSVALLCSFLLEGVIIQTFSEESSSVLASKYYWLIYALLPFLALFNLLSSYSFNFQKTAITSFFRDVFVRILVAILLLFCYFNLITFDTFIRCYILTFWLQSIGMIVYLYRLGELSLSFNFSEISTDRTKEILKYGAVTMLTGSTVYLVNSIDQIMVSFFSENQLADGGIYRIFFYLGVLIIVPYRALVASALERVATAFKEEDYKSIERLYRKTSLLMLGIGIFLFIAVFVNLDNIVKLIGEEYGKGKFVAVFIGLNALFNIASSINGVIISQSKVYRYDLYLNIGLVVLNIILNLVFIHSYGLVGAAMATALTGILYNVFKIGVVKWQFNMQPFSQKSGMIVLLGLATMALNTILPTIPNWFFDALYRTLILGLVYGIVLLRFQLVPDLNILLHSLFEKYTK